jgi:hypothetical protein
VLWGAAWRRAGQEGVAAGMKPTVGGVMGVRVGAGLREQSALWCATWRRADTREEGGWQDGVAAGLSAAGVGYEWECVRWGVAWRSTFTTEGVVGGLDAAGVMAGLRKQRALCDAASRSTFTTEGVVVGLDAAVGGLMRDCDGGRIRWRGGWRVEPCDSATSCGTQEWDH